MIRENIYYWKCDRPNAFHSLEENKKINEKLYIDVKSIMEAYLKDKRFSINSVNSQGNHYIFIAFLDNKKFFIRVEDGPEKDNYMEVEAAISAKMREKNIPVPLMYKVDSSRTQYPFAYQLIEYIDYPDLNQYNKKKFMNITSIMTQLGRLIAQWQSIHTTGYGFFCVDFLKRNGCLKGLHSNYSDYFMLNLDQHLNFLTKHGFFTQNKSNEIMNVILGHISLLEIDTGCIVHKDIALWNLLGTEDRIKSVIDWSDVISGDPTDDISLIACFHDGYEVLSLIEGYKEIKVLPDNFEQRFWLHLLRNMIVKAVIRVGADYFKRDKSFFLIDTDGETLENFTIERIEKAINGLNGKIKIVNL